MQYSLPRLQLELTFSLSVQGDFVLRLEVARALLVSMGRIQALELKDSMIYEVPITLKHFLQCASVVAISPSQNIPPVPYPYPRSPHSVCTG